MKPLSCLGSCFALIVTFAAAQSLDQCPGPELNCTATPVKVASTVICGYQGTVPARNFINPPCISSSFEACRSSCQLYKCISYGYNNATGECRLFNNTLVATGYKRKPLDGFRYWNRKCFKQTCPSGPGACVDGSPAVAPTCTSFSRSISGSALELYNLTGQDPGTCAESNIPDGDQFDFQATIAGQYCAPTCVDPVKNKKYQLLSHGFESNQNYWFGFGYQPGNYSWVQYATNQGYPTIVIDRVGSGQSSHLAPDMVQIPVEVAAYHTFVQGLKQSTSTDAIPPSLTDITYVGHNYGSILGATHAQIYPDDFNALILTGFTSSIKPSCQGFQLQTFAPAAIVDPARYGTLALRYLDASSQAGVVNTFFGSKAQVAFDDTAANTFYTQRDVISSGQYFSAYFGTVTPASEYVNRVLVLTGEEDQIFCGPGSPIIGPAHCGTFLANTGGIFPAADYNYYSVPLTGNALNLHTSARLSFQVAHQFLAGRSFRGS